MTGAHARVFGWCPASVAANWTYHHNFTDFLSYTLSLCVSHSKWCDFIISLGHCLSGCISVFFSLFDYIYYVTGICHKSAYAPIFALDGFTVQKRRLALESVDSKRGMYKDQGGSHGGDFWIRSNGMRWPLIELPFLLNGNHSARRGSINNNWLWINSGT